MQIQQKRHFYLGRLGDLKQNCYFSADFGKIINQIKLPCPNVSSCCLDKLGNLFVTTAKSDNPKDIFGGGLFYINLTKNQANDRS